MAQPGKNSNVEVLRKYVVGDDSVAGTTHTVGSGLNPRITGFSKVIASSSSGMVYSRQIDQKKLDEYFHQEA